MRAIHRLEWNYKYWPFNRLLKENNVCPNKKGEFMCSWEPQTNNFFTNKQYLTPLLPVTSDHFIKYSTWRTLFYLTYGFNIQNTDFVHLDSNSLIANFSCGQKSVHWVINGHFYSLSVLTAAACCRDLHFPLPAGSAATLPYISSWRCRREAAFSHTPQIPPTVSFTFYKSF